MNLLMRMRAIRKKSASSFHALLGGLPPEGMVQVRMGFPSSNDMIENLPPPGEWLSSMSFSPISPYIRVETLCPASLTLGPTA